MDTAYRRTADNLPTNEAVHIERAHGRHELVLSGLGKLDEPASLIALKTPVAQRLPRAELPELLLEVQAWTRFASDFTHVMSMAGPRPWFRAATNEWIVHTALTRRAQIAQVQVARETLHELRTEQRGEGIVWRNADRAFAARLDHGEHMYPTMRPPRSPDVAAGRGDPFTHGAQAHDGTDLERILQTLSFRSEHRNDDLIDDQYAGSRLVRRFSRRICNAASAALAAPAAPAAGPSLQF